MVCKQPYKCLFNHELLIIGTTQTPYQTYDKDIRSEQVEGYIRELASTDVDAVMCCPTAWRRKLWKSEIDRHWQDEAPFIREPLPEHDWKYFEKAYFRLRRYMLAGGDPVGVSLRTARETGKAFFISYRMNDHHYLNYENSPTHCTFWKSHPEYRLPGGYLDYMLPQVRDYYFSILRELTEMYDIDGMELDFMRSPVYFGAGQTESGVTVMTEFVGRVRDMLSEFSAKRGKPLPLCVRVPHIFAKCRAAGLDVAGWDALGLIDMVNISSYYITDFNLEIEEFKRRISGARLYGEMHFITQNARVRSGFSNNITRKTNREIYRTAAYSFLERGCDGVSLFNFDYTRDHHFNEPRREGMYNSEPPFDVLRGIADAGYLKNMPKHYFIGEDGLRLPKTNRATVAMYVADDIGDGVFRRAVMRLATQEKCVGLPFDVRLNGQPLAETMWMGELFVPLSPENLPPYENVRFFEVPPALIKHGENTFDIAMTDSNWTKRAVISCVELALYTGGDFLR